MKPLALVLAAVFLVAGVLYFTGVLQFGTSHAGPHHSHGILLFGLGVLCLIWFRFQSAAPSRR